MKKEGHPPYQDVLFVDTATGTKFVCGTTLQPEETETFEGKEYPVYRVPISSASHPFFTGSKQFIDTEGRVDKFRKRYTSKPTAPSKEKKADDQPEKAEKKVAVKKKTATKKAPAKKASAKKAEIKKPDSE